jgi:glycosyltransferase involved in cell wall biosynthesis
VRGRKIVYCHTPARWLYQSARYLGTAAPRGARAALLAQRRFLLEWDREAAASASRYIANSTIVRDRIRSAYGIDAEIVPPPYTLDPGGPQRAPSGVEPGFALTVSRLLPYKNVDAVVAAQAGLPQQRLVVAGDGPDVARLRRDAPANVIFTGAVGDDELRWLYANCTALVAASYEDFGLTPVEAAAFGKPAAVLRYGGYLDTIAEDTGVFFDRPVPSDIRGALARVHGTTWDAVRIRAHAATFSEAAFADRMREIVTAEAS